MEPELEPKINNFGSATLINNTVIANNNITTVPLLLSNTVIPVENHSQ